jgi:primosomal protein N' (replication factor Y)
LQSVFGEKVVIYHSKFSDNERVDIWKKLLHESEPMVVIGARSSIFLPFSHLGLVIVDEEHESSYKQYDPAPRYNARDVAMILARMHGAKTLLGSATPAVETYYKAQNGKFGLVTLDVRYGDVKLPEIEIVDMKHASRTGAVRGVFANETERLAREAIARGSQVIFFQNRRGYAPLARCKQCAWVPRCEHCDVALTYHSHLRQLQCHYCGAVYPLPSVCPQCKEPAIEILGYGTERVGEEVGTAFHGVKMLRMDLDTTRNKDSYEKIIDDFSAGKAKILVGTQMVTKGLDFGGVEMVGVLNADALINFPDFRSSERAFNMLEQVSGRAGRRSGQSGVVVVQSYQPEHPVLGFLKSHNYLGFYQNEIAARRQFYYPPFTRIIYLYVKHRDPARLRGIADRYAARLRQLLGSRVFGPEEPSIARIQGLYIRKIMLKIEVTASVTKVKDLLRQTYVELCALPDMKGTVVYYDVDPQ